MTEGIRISTNNFKYAAWYLRLAALLIDKAIICLLVLLLVPGSFKIVTLLMGFHLMDALNFLGTIDGIWFIMVPVVYFILTWGFFSRTAGMMLLKTRIADYNGQKIGWMKAVLRVFAFYLSLILLGLGFLPILFDKKRQGLHDKLTKTMVVMKR
jgi:uncharacterized RDD family membrane protein YckC